MVLFAAVAVLSANMATAAEQQSQEKVNLNREDKPAAADPAIDQAQLMQNLVTFGRETMNAPALALAGQILKGLSPKPLKAEKESKSGDGEAKGKPKEPENLSPESLMAEARKVAAGDKDMLAAVETIGEMGATARGPVGGTIIRSDVVRARTTDIWTVTMRGGESWTVYVSGDGDTDLDLYVYDENGNLIDSDTDYTDECLCSGWARWTGTFQIRIGNLGYVWNAYTMVIR
jgi:hypothetical protein